MTPQKNGKSEVFNRIIVDNVRTMLLESGLPKTLWAEALMCAVYTKNRSQTKGNPDFKYPFEMLFGKLSSFSRLKCFGTIAFRLDKSVSKKIDPKIKGTTWFQAPKMAKKLIFCLFAGNESSDSATTDYETLGVCGE